MRLQWENPTAESLVKFGSTKVNIGGLKESSWERSRTRIPTSVTLYR